MDVCLMAFIGFCEIVWALSEWNQDQYWNWLGVNIWFYRIFNQILGRNVSFSAQSINMGHQFLLLLVSVSFEVVMISIARSLSLFPTLFSLTISFLFISSTLSSSSPSCSLFLSIPLYVLLSPKRSLSFSLAISFQAISFVSCHSFPSLFISIASLFPCLLFRFLFLSPLLLLCSSLQTTQPINFSYRVKSLGDCAVFISNVLLFYFQYENWMFRDIHKIVRANWSVCIFCIYVSTLDNDDVMSSIFFP